MEETIFDKILTGKIPSTSVYEDDHVLAFKDLNPQAPVHVLVIPKIKAVKFSDYKDRDINEAGLFFNRVAKIATLLDLDKEGYRIVINSGKHGQQTVDYVHAHIIGGRQLNWPPG